MAHRAAVRTTFEPTRVIEPIYTGGDVGLSEDGHVLATCLADEVMLSDPSSGSKLARIAGDGEVVTTIALTPSASHIVICSRSLSMRIYALEQTSNETIRPRLLRTIKPHTSPVVTSSIDRTGTLLATGGADGIVKVWDIRGGYTTHTFHGHSGVVSALHFFEVDASKEASEQRANNKKRRKSEQYEQTREFEESTTSGYRLASGSEDGQIRIWNLQKRKPTAVLNEHVSVVRSLDFDDSEQILVSGSRDKTIIFWDTSTWTQRNTIPVLEGVEACHFMGQQHQVCTGGDNGRLRLWNSTTGEEITHEQTPAPEGQSILQTIHRAPLSYVLSVHADQTILFHSIQGLPNSRQASKKEILPVFRRICGTHDEVIDMAFVGGKNDLLAIATNTEDVRMLSIKPLDTHAESNGTQTSIDATYFGADAGLLQGHDDIIICMDIDWSGHWLVTGAKDNTARLWSIDAAQNSFSCNAIFTGHAESLGAISLPRAAPPEGSAAHTLPLEHPPPFLLTGSQDKTIKRWDISPSVSSSSDTAQKPPRAVYTRKAHDKDINALDVNHTSTLFASASQDRTVKVWSLEDGEAVGILRGHRRGVWSVKFAPKHTPAITGEAGGQVSSARGLILTGSGDKTVKVWSLADYSCLRTFEGHTNSVLKVLWLPPPPLMLANNEETDYMELDVEEEQPTRQHERRDKSKSVQVASAGSDGLVKVWDVSSSELACTLDNHTDRVWALTASASTSSQSRILISGAADSLITFWTDTTSSTASLALKKSTARITQDQDLQNHIRARNYHSAITLALTLNHPGRLLSLFSEVCNAWPRDEGSLTGRRQVDEVLRGLGDSHLWLLLERCREWNVSARSAPVAQKVLGALLKLLPASRFTALRGDGADSSDMDFADEGKRRRRARGNMKDLLEALRVYTERHYRRLEDLIDESYILEYTLNEMDEVASASSAVNRITANGHTGLDNDDEDDVMLLA